MKARNLILSLGIVGLALSGPVLADNSDLRAAMQADAAESLAEARTEFRVKPGSLMLPFDAGTHAALPLPKDVSLVAESDAPDGENAPAGDETGADSGEMILGGLVVYIGNR